MCRDSGQSSAVSRQQAAGSRQHAEWISNTHEPRHAVTPASILRRAASCGLRAACCVLRARAACCELRAACSVLCCLLPAYAPFCSDVRCEQLNIRLSTSALAEFVRVDQKSAIRFSPKEVEISVQAASPESLGGRHSARLHSSRATAQIVVGFLADLVTLVVRMECDLLRDAPSSCAMGGGCGGQYVASSSVTAVARISRTVDGSGPRVSRYRDRSGKDHSALPLFVGDSQLVVVDQKRRDPNRQTSTIVEIPASHHLEGENCVRQRIRSSPSSIAR